MVYRCLWWFLMQFIQFSLGDLVKIQHGEPGQGLAQNPAVSVTTGWIYMGLYCLILRDLNGMNHVILIGINLMEFIWDEP